MSVAMECFFFLLWNSFFFIGLIQRREDSRRINATGKLAKRVYVWVSTSTSIHRENQTRLVHSSFTRVCHCYNRFFTYITRTHIGYINTSIIQPIWYRAAMYSPRQVYERDSEAVFNSIKLQSNTPTKRLSIRCVNVITFNDFIILFIIFTHSFDYSNYHTLFIEQNIDVAFSSRIHNGNWKILLR